jgi:hypothetical protein
MKKKTQVSFQVSADTVSPEEVKVGIRRTDEGGQRREKEREREEGDER